MAPQSEDSKIYIHNNGKGWAVFKKNPGHHRDFAYCDGEWSLAVATYHKTKEEAEAVLAEIRRENV